MRSGRYMRASQVLVVLLGESLAAHSPPRFFAVTSSGNHGLGLGHRDRIGREFLPGQQRTRDTLQGPPPLPRRSGRRFGIGMDQAGLLGMAETKWHGACGRRPGGEQLGNRQRGSSSLGEALSFVGIGWFGAAYECIEKKHFNFASFLFFVFLFFVCVCGTTRRSNPVGVRARLVPNPIPSVRLRSNRLHMSRYGPHGLHKLCLSLCSWCIVRTCKS